MKSLRELQIKRVKSSTPIPIQTYKVSTYPFKSSVGAFSPIKFNSSFRDSRPFHMGSHHHFAACRVVLVTAPEPGEPVVPSLAISSRQAPCIPLLKRFAPDKLANEPVWIGSRTPRRRRYLGRYIGNKNVEFRLPSWHVSCGKWLGALYMVVSGTARTSLSAT